MARPGSGERRPARYVVLVQEHRHEVDVHPNGDVVVDGRRRCASLEKAAPPAGCSLIVDGASVRLLGRGGRAGSWQLDRGGRTVDVEVLDERRARIRELSASAAGPTALAPLNAPMPGLVVQVAVQAGDLVSPGDAIATMEAMKMENELRAKAAAIVSRVLVRPGDAVDKGQTIAEFAPAEAE